MARQSERTAIRLEEDELREDGQGSGSLLSVKEMLADVLGSEVIDEGFVVSATRLLGLIDQKRVSQFFEPFSNEERLVFVHELYRVAQRYRHYKPRNDGSGVFESHILGVLEILIVVEGVTELDMLLSAMNHDVVEDFVPKGLPENEVKEREALLYADLFRAEIYEDRGGISSIPMAYISQQVRADVKAMTKFRKAREAYTDEATFERFLTAASEGPRGIVLKLADRQHNTGTIDGHVKPARETFYKAKTPQEMDEANRIMAKSIAKQEKIMNETLKRYLPLARIAKMRGAVRELVADCMAFFNPDLKTEFDAFAAERRAKRLKPAVRKKIAKLFTHANEGASPVDLIDTYNFIDLGLDNYTSQTDVHYRNLKFDDLKLEDTPELDPMFEIVVTTKVDPRLRKLKVERARDEVYKKDRKEAQRYAEAAVSGKFREGIIYYVGYKTRFEKISEFYESRVTEEERHEKLLALSFDAESRVPGHIKDNLGKQRAAEKIFSRLYFKLVDGYFETNASAQEKESLESRIQKNSVIAIKDEKAIKISEFLSKKADQVVKAAFRELSYKSMEAVANYLQSKFAAGVGAEAILVKPAENDPDSVYGIVIRIFNPQFGGQLCVRINDAEIESRLDRGVFDDNSIETFADIQGMIRAILDRTKAKYTGLESVQANAESELLKPRVKVYTGDGKRAMILPKDAVVADFAAAVHGQVLVGAQRAFKKSSRTSHEPRKEVGLFDRLEDGAVYTVKSCWPEGKKLDQIDMSRIKVDRKWLVLCGTSYAAAQLRSYFHALGNTENIEAGRSYLNNLVEIFGMKFDDFVYLISEKYSRRKQSEEILMMVGRGDINPLLLLAEHVDERTRNWVNTARNWVQWKVKPDDSDEIIEEKEAGKIAVVNKILKENHLWEVEFTVPEETGSMYKFAQEFSPQNRVKIAWAKEHTPGVDGQLGRMRWVFDLMDAGITTYEFFRRMIDISSRYQLKMIGKGLIERFPFKKAREEVG